MTPSINSPNEYTASNAPTPLGTYPHARRVGDILFLSGIGPRHPETNTVPGVSLNQQGDILDYDIEAQCHAVFENVKIVLESSGARWEQLVDITVFLINIEQDFEVYNKIYASYFKRNKPCRTTVGVSALPSPIAIELKCIAYLGSET